MDIQNNKRIAKNTLYLYLRTFITMAVSIFTSRVILEALGINDFGIYNVVGGFVAMFSMLTNTLSSASQRFLSFEMGKREKNLHKVFSATMSIHIVLALGVFIVFESIGIWFLNNHMNIAIHRLNAANWVFQCSVLTFCINLLSIPYNASIIAHEKMSVFAYISIYEAFAKLGIVYMLYLFRGDKLIEYAILMLLIAVSLRLIYGIYCTKHFQECKLKFIYDKDLYKKILSFCGWNFFGTSAGILNTQGVNILINLFFGVTFNAARGIAEQINGAVNRFVNDFQQALNPQITKSFAHGDYHTTRQLICSGAKYAALMFWLLSLPFILQTEFILDVWLVEVPDYAPIFVRLALIYTFCQSLAVTIFYGILATGEIKKYHLIVSGINIMAFPVTYILFKFGFPAEYGYITAIFFTFCLLFIRIILLGEKLKGFTIGYYVKQTLVRAITVVVISYFLTDYIQTLLCVSKTQLFFIIIGLSLIINIIVILAIGLNSKERSFIIKHIVQKVTR